jgi:hypothetical protein
MIDTDFPGAAAQCSQLGESLLAAPAGSSRFSCLNDG